MHFCEMTMRDYETVIGLWRSVEGVGLSSADSREAIARYLARNPGLSFTAWEGADLVGAVLCGHDGRRGYVHHLAVRESHRHRGIGRTLIERCLAEFKAAGIEKCHILVFAANAGAITFWKQIGWTQREELVVMSRYTGG